MGFFERLARTKRAAKILALADDGAVVTLILGTLGYAAIGLGIWSTGEAINNKLTVSDATSNMRQQADTIRQKAQGGDSPQAKTMLQNADLMDAAANKMDSDENWNVGVSVAGNVLDAATFGVTSKSKGIYQATKVVWDGYTGTQIGQNALNLVQDQDQQTSDGVKLLQQIQWDKGGATTDDGSQPDYSKQSPVDGFIFQTKANVMNGEVSALFPDADPELITDLSTSLVLDNEIDNLSNPASEVTLTDENPFLTGDVAGMTAKIDPNNALGVEMGQVSMDPDDQSALETGEKPFVIGQYYGANGMEPVVLSNDPTSGLQTEFTLLPDQPVVDTGDNYKPVIEDMPDWWDGTVDSCPYLYAWDGRSFVSVNDIISVSRDPEREYDDYIVFSSVPRMSGSHDVRIIEVRNEESWIDHMSFRSVDVPDGYGATASVDGEVFSTGLLRAPDQVDGVRSARLGRIDGDSVRIYDGLGPEAVWRGVGENAVLLVSLDGFEDDGDPGSLLFQRPTVWVEVWDGDSWEMAGLVRPRAEMDTVAVDLSGLDVEGTLRVRLSSDSCHVGKFQVLDRLALSTADRTLAEVTEVEISAATMGGADVSSQLAAVDDVRVHTLPGDTIDISIQASDSEMFVVKSRGWYRPLE